MTELSERYDLPVASVDESFTSRSATSKLRESRQSGILGSRIRKEQIDSLAALGDLEALIADNNEIHSIESLAALSNLKEVDLSENHIEDLTPLQHLVQLSSVFVAGNMIQDIRPLEELSSLEVLDLSNNQLL